MGWFPGGPRWRHNALCGARIPCFAMCPACFATPGLPPHTCPLFLAAGGGTVRTLAVALVALWSVTVAPDHLVAAQQPSSLRFEVTSIKLWRPPTAPLRQAAVPATPPGSGSFNRATTVAALITYAYDLQDPQLSGGEEWVRTERYDVAARAGREVSQTELREMVKALLA